MATHAIPQLTDVYMKTCTIPVYPKTRDYQDRVEELLRLQVEDEQIEARLKAEAAAGKARRAQIKARTTQLRTELVARSATVELEVYDEPHFEQNLVVVRRSFDGLEVDKRAMTAAERKKLQQTTLPFTVVEGGAAGSPAPVAAAPGEGAEPSPPTSPATDDDDEVTDPGPGDSKPAGDEASPEEKVAAEVQTAHDMLGLVMETPPELAVVAGWTAKQRQVACDWAGAIHVSASDNPGVRIPKRPKFIPADKPNAENRAHPGATAPRPLPPGKNGHGKKNGKVERRVTTRV